MKNLIFIATFTASLVIKTRPMKINTELLSSTAHELVENALKRGEMQDYLDSLSYERRSSGNDSLDAIIDAVGKKFKERVEAIQRLQTVTIQVISKSFDVNPVRGCCSVLNTTYDPRFRTKVNTESACNQFSPTAASSTQRMSIDSFTNLCKENLKKLPSIKWQYFASEEGSSVFYPATNSPECATLDSRFRPWYVQTNVPTPKQVVIALDKSGSMDFPYKGIPLLKLAKDAVKSLIATLNPNDKFAVVIFSSMPETITDLHGDELCFSYRLAQASPQNKRRMSEYVDTIKASGGTNYGNALTRAFHLLHKDYNATSGDNIQRVILFVSDGSPDDSRQAIFNKLSKSSESINHTAIVMTYGVGDKDFSLLKDIAAFIPNITKKGLFFSINDTTPLRNKMVSYYKHFAAESRNVTEPIWTTPYLDSFGIGQVVTGSLPVIIGKELIGVVAADFLLSELVLDSANFNIQRFSYSFIVSGAGLIMNHPLYPYRTDHESINLYATALERDPEFISIFESMKRGEDGNKSIVSTTLVGNDGSSFGGAATEPINSTYIWKKIPRANFSICVVLALKEKHLHFPSQNSVLPNSLVHHRFDLVLPPSPCIHLNNLASKYQTSLFLAARTFHNYDTSFPKQRTANDVQELIKYFEGSGSNKLELKGHVKGDVVATQYAQNLWNAADGSLSSLQRHILWRYIGVESGVFRLFPGGQIPDQYDPTTRSWYILAIENKEKMVISTPYLDAVLEAPVITFAQTVFKRSFGEDGEAAKEVFGVMGVDVSLRYFNDLINKLYADWIQDYKTYVINSVGDVIMAEEYIGEGDQSLRFRATTHLTVLEPEISDFLISNGSLIRVTCSSPENGLLERRYKFSRGNQNIFRKQYKENNSSCFEFAISHLPNTNAFILFRNKVKKPCEDDIAENVTACSCDYVVEGERKRCSTSWIQQSECECPCLDNDPDFDLCTSSFGISRRNHTPACLPEPSVLSDVINAIDLSQLPMCYEGFEENRERVSAVWSIVGLLLFGATVGIIVILVHYLGENLKAKKKKNLAKRRATLKFQKNLVTMFEKAMIAQPNKVYHHQDRNARPRRHSTRSEQTFTHSQLPENVSSIFLYVPRKKPSLHIRKRRSINKVASTKIIEENEPLESDGFETYDSKQFSRTEMRKTSATKQIGEGEIDDEFHARKVKTIPMLGKADVPESKLLERAIKLQNVFENNSNPAVHQYSNETYPLQSLVQQDKHLDSKAYSITHNDSNTSTEV